MAKRFTDTQKYHKPFIRGLQGAYKLLWDFLYCECDHAGIWIADFEIAQILIGSDMLVNKEDALKYFNKDERKIIEVDNGKKWFIPSFIEFQYGELNPENRAHKSVILILKKYNLYDDKKGLISPSKGCKDMDMDKDKDKDKDKKKNSIPNIDEFTQYFIENGYSKELALRAWKGYEAANWYDSQGKKIKNWKQKAQHVWFRDENKPKKQRLEVSDFDN